MSEYASFVDLLRSLGDASSGAGVTLVTPRFRESFHSYPELYRQSLAFAHHFRAQGVRSGQKVLVSLSADTDSICSFFALVYLGAVPHSVPSPLLSQDRDAHRRQIAKLVERHSLDRILFSPGLRGIAGAFPGIPAEMEIAPPREDLRNTADGPDPAPTPPAPDDVAFVQFSSGSTSRPKGVQITHRNLLYNLRVIVDNDRRSDRSVMVSWLPLCHDMGFVGCLLSNLIYKNNLVLMDPLCFITRPVSWLAAVSRSRGTVTAVPNFCLDVCALRIKEQQLREHSIDLSTFRYVYCGSEPVRVSSIRRFEEKFERYGFVPGSVYPVYGMSEATLIISAPKIQHSVVVKRIEDMSVPSVGQPLGDFEVQIRDDAGVEMGPDRVGELWIRGTSVTPGYLSSAAGNGGPDSDGWLATGDLGLTDSEGRIYITGRQKDLIIYQGRNFYGHDIASRIEELPYVKTGKVFAFAVDIDDEEKIVIMTVPPRRSFGGTPEKVNTADAGDLTSPEARLEDFKAEIRGLVLREFGLPVDDVVVTKQIPKTTSGKIARHRCAQIYRSLREEVPARVPADRAT